jgi:hypothetical protein
MTVRKTHAVASSIEAQTRRTRGSAPDGSTSTVVASS